MIKLDHSGVGNNATLLTKAKIITFAHPRAFNSRHSVLLAKDRPVDDSHYVPKNLADL